MSKHFLKIVDGKKVPCGLLESAKFFCENHLRNAMKEFHDKKEYLFYYTAGFRGVLSYFKYVLTDSEHWDKQFEEPLVDIQTVYDASDLSKEKYKFILVKIRTNLILMANITDIENTPPKFIPVIATKLVDIANRSLSTMRQDGKVYQVICNDEFEKFGVKHGLI